MPTLAQQAIAESLREEAAERASTGAPRTLAQQAIDQSVAEESGPRPSLRDLHAEALRALERLDDYTSLNETEWDALGGPEDKRSLDRATFWRVKSGQALKALQEIKMR